MTIPVFRLRYAQHTEALQALGVEDPVLPNWLSPAGKDGRTESATLWKGKKDMADSREVMNIRQASQYLGVSPDTLYKYVNEQKIPAFKLGNRWRFKKSKLDQWMDEKSMELEGRGRKKPKAAVKAAGTP